MNTEQALRCTHVAMLCAVQGIVLIILWHHYEREIRQAYTEAERQWRETWEKAYPKPLRGKLWDDVEEAMHDRS